MPALRTSRPARRGELIASTYRRVERSPTAALYLWVLEQNAGARAFYEARGGKRTGSAPVGPPGGVEGRLNGAPQKLRYAWLDPAVLLG